MDLISFKENACYRKCLLNLSPNFCIAKFVQKISFYKKYSISLLLISYVKLTQIFLYKNFTKIYIFIKKLCFKEILWYI